MQANKVNVSIWYNEAWENACHGMRVPHIDEKFNY